MAYFVTIRRGSRWAPLAGPFNRHGDALSAEPACRHIVADRGGRHAFDPIGTARIPRAPIPVGLFNEQLGLPTDGSRT